MIRQLPFGKMPNGTIVEQFCLTNTNGVKIEILNLGGIIRRWLIPKSQSSSVDIVLGFDTVQEYLADDSYLGALVGRYANRINEGKFALAGNHYQTDVNLGEHCLHGGSQGFSHKVWESTVVSSGDNPSLMLELVSPNGEQGFPGNLSVKVIYTLTEQNALKIEYFANSDITTIYNPTNHSYFNLSGHNSGSVENHQIQLLASHFTPTNKTAIPTGDIATVDCSPFDFRSLTKISQALTSDHQQIHNANGLDHNLCLDDFEPNCKEAKYCGQTISEDEDIQLKIYTSMPGIQIFTANHFDNKVGKEGVVYQAHQGVCFETQFYPDSPNHSHFPSATLEASNEFYSVTEYQVQF